MLYSLTTVLLLLVVLVSSALGAPANVCLECFDAVSGSTVYAYFAGEPIIDSPITIQTSQYMHGSSGFFIIPKEHSAHFLSTQFPSAACIPAGVMIIDFWAQPTAADGSGADSALIVSAYTTDSQGAIQDTLLDGQVTSPFPEESGQVTSVFGVAGGYVPALGFIEVVLTAPESSAIKVFWGSDEPSNFQVIFNYG